MAKPFIKWAGGKKQLINQLITQLPTNFQAWDDVTYIEPFVGGGAMLFYMLEHYPNIQRAIVNDINSDLVGCYRTIKDAPYELINALKELQTQYYALTTDGEKKDFFLRKRVEYNEVTMDQIAKSALFIFLNRTCFNGLYRVNRKGKFNVPFGKSKHPTICDEETILSDHELLQRVEILNGDFEQTINYAEGNTLFYFDPPYRPLSATSSFTDYTAQSFDDDSQKRLKNFCDAIDNRGFYFMLSNSDSRLDPFEVSFFDELYEDYQIERVQAYRNINAVASGRGLVSEILVHNYEIEEAV